MSLSPLPPSGDDGKHMFTYARTHGGDDGAHTRTDTVEIRHIKFSLNHHNHVAMQHNKIPNHPSQPHILKIIVFRGGEGVANPKLIVTMVFLT